MAPGSSSDLGRTQWLVPSQEVTAATFVDLGTTPGCENFRKSRLEAGRRAAAPTPD
jgi:hypothetical protein